MISLVIFSSKYLPSVLENRSRSRFVQLLMRVAANPRMVRVYFCDHLFHFRSVSLSSSLSLSLSLSTVLISLICSILLTGKHSCIFKGKVSMILLGYVGLSVPYLLHQFVGGVQVSICLQQVPNFRNCLLSLSLSLIALVNGFTQT